MSYTNPRHEGRLILIPNLQDAFAILHVSERLAALLSQRLRGLNPICFIKCDEVGSGNDRALFNFPFLFSANGNPWHEANDYLLSLMRDRAPASRRH
ncbi:hypothetical protein [Pseudomonas aeruginosa]|uniref:hypothetical protein n=1 Tax=Pseudomonas aeruginosa TaxID=287 RepID=UPI0020CC98ED|nr:hypothetical protein [Pseudomonas aeruginosa]